MLKLCHLHRVPGVVVDGYEECPVVHLRLAESQSSRQVDCTLLDQIVQDCHNEGVAIVTAKYLELEEHKLPPPRYSQ